MGNFISHLFVEPVDMGADLDAFYGWFQVLFHGLVYAYVLFNASNMISEGSELLLLTPYKGLVGSVVLPVLGAVPDGAIILFSKPDALSVGVGALAGSTIMLLTIPWCLAMVAGRVDLAVPKAKDPQSPLGGAAASDALMAATKPVPKYSGRPDQRLTDGVPLMKQLFQTGVSVDSSIKRAGVMMMVTSLSYIIVQFPGFGFHCQYTDCDCDKNTTGPHDEPAPPMMVEDCLENKFNAEKPYVYVSLGLSIALFIYYIYDQYKQSKKDDNGKMARRIEEIGKKAMASGLNVDFCVFLNSGHERGLCGPCFGGSEELELQNLTDSGAKLTFDRAIVTLFNKYNKYSSSPGQSEVIDSIEIGQLLTDLRMNGTPLYFKLKEAAETKNLTLPLFSKLCWDYVLEAGSHNLAGSVRVEAHQDVQQPQAPEGEAAAAPEAEDEDYDEDEELEVPEGMEGKDLSQPAQQREIWKRAMTQMLVGTTIVMFFSDPMCDILGNIGKRSGINAFYVSFVLAPLASNASELIAAYNYALKKTVKTMTISISTLIGAACMNNTFCLAIFLIKIVQSGNKVWQYSAETIAILAVEYFMFYFALKEHHVTVNSILILTIFPVSIALVALLEAAGLD